MPSFYTEQNAKMLSRFKHATSSIKTVFDDNITASGAGRNMLLVQKIHHSTVGQFSTGAVSFIT